MRNLLGELRQASRRLWRQRAFASAVVATMALGIGSVALVYSEIDALALRPLAIRDAAHVVELSIADSSGAPFMLLPADAERLREALRGRATVAAQAQRFFALRAGAGRPFSVAGRFVDPEYLRVLQVRPARGRLLAAGDVTSVVVSHALWRTRFGAADDVVGRGILVNGRPATIVGVAEEEFTGINRVIAEDVWIPLDGHEAFAADAGPFRPLPPSVSLVARLARGTTAASLGAFAERWARVARLRDASGAMPARVTVRPVGALPAGVAGVLRDRLGSMLGAGIVLLLACANVSSMLLVRAAARRQEIVVRLALGVTRARLVRMFLAEALLLFGAGAVAGVAVSTFVLRLRGATVWPPLPVRLTTTYDPNVRLLLLVFGTMLAACVAFSLVPGAHAWRTNLAGALRATVGARRRWGLSWQNGFVAAQVALAVMLMAAAASLMQGILRAQRTQDGFDPAGVVVAAVDGGTAGLSDAALRARYRSALDAALQAGFTHAAWTSALPASGRTSVRVVHVTASAGHAVAFPVQVQAVTSGYLETLRIPLVRGRGLTRADDEARPAGEVVAVVGATFAQRAWPGAPAVGQLLDLGGRRTARVVGVASDVRTEPGAVPLIVYLPLATEFATDAFLGARGAGDADTRALDALLRTALADVPVSYVTPYARLLGGARAGLRTVLSRVATFAAAGLAVAAAGLYALLTYGVLVRRREIGVRLALGASRRDVLLDVLRRGGSVAGTGAVLGVAGGAVLVILMRASVPGAAPLGWPLAAVIAATLTLAVLLALVLPARAATRVDPVESLRADSV